MSAAPIPPDGYTAATYWHPSHQPCAKTGSADPVVVFVPVNKSKWAGVTCGACGQLLVNR